MAEQHCVDCAVTNCAKCDSDFRMCDACAVSYNLIETREIGSGAVVQECVEECPAGYFSLSSKGRRVCTRTTFCLDKQVEEAAATTTSDRICVYTDSSSGGDDDSGTTVAVTLSMVILAFIILFAIFKYRERQLKMKAFDFQEASTSQIIPSLPLFFTMAPKSRFDMCFCCQHFAAGGKTRLKSRIKKFNPHF